MSNFDEEVRQIDMRGEEKIQDFLKGVASKLPLLVGIGIAVF